MTAFDGTTAERAPQALASAAPAYPADTYHPDTGLSTLSLLTQTVADRVDIEEHTVAVPGGRIKLVCHTDIPERSLRKWQRASLPPEKRKGQGASTATALDQNQLVMAVSVLVHTVIRIEVLARDNETWLTVEHDDEPLTLANEAVLSAFRAIDTTSALITIFGRESDIIRASQEVLQACGWSGENGADDEDPS